MSKIESFEQTDVDLVNHSIKLENSDLIHFFYPEYKVVTGDVMIVNGPVIYTGPPEYLNKRVWISSNIYYYFRRI